MDVMEINLKWVLWSYEISVYIVLRNTFTDTLHKLYITQVMYIHYTSYFHIKCFTLKYFNTKYFVL